MEKQSFLKMNQSRNNVFTCRNSIYHSPFTNFSFVLSLRFSLSLPFSSLSLPLSPFFFSKLTCDKLNSGRRNTETKGRRDRSENKARINIENGKPGRTNERERGGGRGEEGKREGETSLKVES